MLEYSSSITDFHRFFGLSWETSTFNNYHPEDSKRSGKSLAPRKTAKIGENRRIVDLGVITTTGYYPLGSTGLSINWPGD